MFSKQLTFRIVVLLPSSGKNIKPALLDPLTISISGMYILTKTLFSPFYPLPPPLTHFYCPPPTPFHLRLSLLCLYLNLLLSFFPPAFNSYSFSYSDFFLFFSQFIFLFLFIYLYHLFSILYFSVLFCLHPFLLLQVPSHVLFLISSSVALLCPRAWDKD